MLHHVTQVYEYLEGCFMSLDYRVIFIKCVLACFPKSLESFLGVFLSKGLSYVFSCVEKTASIIRIGGHSSIIRFLQRRRRPDSNTRDISFRYILMARKVGFLT